MNWESLYGKLIAERNDSFGERHHIIPRHDGGTDSDGIVLLTRRNHTLAHYIRWRWKKQAGDFLAYKMMSGLSLNAMQIGEYKEKHQKAVSNKSSEWKARIGKVRKGRTYEELYGDDASIQKAKRASKGVNNGMYGRKHTQDTLHKIRAKKAKYKLSLKTPENKIILFESKEELIRYGFNAGVISNNVGKGKIAKGKWKDYSLTYR